MPQRTLTATLAGQANTQNEHPLEKRNASRFTVSGAPGGRTASKAIRGRQISHVTMSGAPLKWKTLHFTFGDLGFRALNLRALGLRVLGLWVFGLWAFGPGGPLQRGAAGNRAFGL